MTTEWILLDEVDSTNTYCRAHGLANDTVVLAARQLAGKGRDGRRFVSHTGGMYLSLVRRDGWPTADCVRYMLAAPLAVCRVLERVGIDAAVKWPNDVWVHGAKIAGILIETVWSEGVVSEAVLGIGLNVCNDLRDVPCKATTVHAEGAKGSVRHYAEAVVQALQGCLSLPTEVLVREVRQRMLNLGKTVTRPDGSEGVAVDLSSDGRLLVRCADGLRAVAAGDVFPKEEIC